MRNSLRAGGKVCTQAETTWLDLDLIQSLAVSAREKYDSVQYAVTQIPTYPCGMIGFLISSLAPEAKARTAREERGGCSAVRQAETRVFNRGFGKAQVLHPRDALCVVRASCVRKSGHLWRGKKCGPTRQPLWQKPQVTEARQKWTRSNSRQIRMCLRMEFRLCAHATRFTL